ncbi:MAG: hypothetical protein JXP34_11690 [Planctomycetes bacterium]|nr:hypothetical protein [Planctomycetota bacterium]
MEESYGSRVSLRWGAAIVLAGVLSAVPAAQAQSVPFKRGDSNSDGLVNIGDAVFTLSYQFASGPVPQCVKTADTNDDGKIDIGDPVSLLNYLFAQGPAPAAPFGVCGVDPTSDALPCDSYPPCGEPVPDVPEVDVLASDATKFAARLRFPRAQLLPVRVGDDEFVQLLLPAVQSALGDDGAGGVGMPGVPVVYRLLAFPEGSKPILRFGDGSVRKSVVEGVLLYPRQEAAYDRDFPPVKDGQLPPDDFFVDPPFAFDEKAYDQDQLFPPEIVSMRNAGRMRDVNLVEIGIAAGQYNPSKKTLFLHEEVEFAVEFEGGEGSFLPAQAGNPFESFNNRAIVERSILNGVQIYEHIGDIIRPWTCIGEELMIITAPALLDAANDLADWKRDKGFVTSVYTTGPAASGGIGTTASQIQGFIRSHYEDCAIRLSYLLLLGDAELIPPFYRSSSGSSTTGTDLDYSLMTAGDLLADIGVARIPVDTLGQAQVVVDKIIGYEKTPPFSPNFYGTASFPAYFQCCRTDIVQQGTTSRAYIQTMETVRSGLIAAGKTVERLYTSNTGYHPSYAGDTTPRRYYDGTSLPAAIGPGSGFSWNATVNDVIASFNAGRFLVIHRDHGGQNGWVYPGLSTSNVASLSNGTLLPVLFSVDCATGFFDNETAGGDYGTTSGGVYLLEALLRKSGGGVVGALGDTRNSPTWANNALTRGFADAIFPGVLPSYGSNTRIRRLADILNYGKLYMFTQVGVAQPAGSVTTGDANSENVMWHAFGDPTQEIWTSQPLTLVAKYALEFLRDRLVVALDEDGAVVTAMQDGKPIGRGRVVKGEAVLPFVDEPPDPDRPIDLFASKEDMVSVRLTPPPNRDLESEKAFGPNARRITFDPREGREVGEVVDTQYQGLGVTFANARTTRPTIIDDKMREGKTFSDGQSLANDSDFPATSSGVPLTIRFKPVVQRVGMYIGNGDGRTSAATLTAYDVSGAQIFAVRRTGFGNDVLTFIGLETDSAGIAEVRLDYGETLSSEEIDDLLFE